jgi:hypothetical protein
MSEPPNVVVEISNSAPNTVRDTVTTPRVKLYFPGQKYLLYFAALYVSLLLLLAIPYIQRK